jgi:hypothetical protein
VSAEEIRRVLMENPSILVDVLVARPAIIYEVLSKLTPWQNLATKDDIKQLVTKEEAKNFATKDDIRAIRAEMATKDDIKQLVTKEEAKNFATKDDIKQLVTKEEAKNFATKDDIKRLEVTLNALGARWGILSEDSFRQGVMEILKETGWKVDVVVLYDKTGYVYDEPSEVEVDVVVRDGRVFLIEITSSLKRGDLPIIKRKREFYERQTQRKVDQVLVVTPFIHDKYQDRVKAMAKDMGIIIVYPKLDQD